MIDGEKLTKESFSDLTLILLEYMKINVEDELKGGNKTIENLMQIKKNVDEHALHMVMTSELVHLSMVYGDRFKEDIFMDEWKRRVTKIGMDESQMNTLLEREKKALSVEVNKRDVLWFIRRPLWEGMTKDDIPPVEHLTWSEINLLTDYARYLKAVAHEHMPNELWIIVAEHAYNQPYAVIMKEEGEAIGITEKIMGDYWYNEGSILSKYKYKYHSGPTEWEEKKDE